MTRPKIETRFARDEDGPRIGEMAKANGFDFDGLEIDWSRVQPYWIVALREGVVVAAIQALHALPMGRMDHLVIDPELTKIERFRVVEAVTDAAQQVLAMAGCQLASSCIDLNREDDYEDVARKRGWVPVSTVNLLWKRIR